MALTQRLQMRQSQALVMTPQLMQAIKLLQLSNLDLSTYVEGELEKNPLLERAEHDGAVEAGPDQAGPNDGNDASHRDSADTNVIGEDLETSRGAIEERLGTDLENVFPDDAPRAEPHPGSDQPAGYSEWASTGGGGREDGDYNLESFVSAAPTLADHLAGQLALAESDPVRRMIGQYLIDMIDEAGYLTGDLPSVAEKLGATVAEVELVLSILQTFEPLGVCARNLAECLAIQLKERDRFDPAMQALVGRLDMLAKRDQVRSLAGV